MKFTFIFCLAIIFISLTIVSVSCKTKEPPVIDTDNELKKVIFVNGWYHGFLAAQRLVRNGAVESKERDLQLFKDSVDFATYIDKK